MVLLSSRTLGAGKPLVMLHGLFGSGENLGGIARILSEEYQVILIDLRNHGKSPHIDSITYAQMADDVIETMDHLGIEMAHLFGHSMGGKTAMQLALTYPDRVSKLVVGDIAPVMYSRHHDKILAGTREVGERGASSRDEARSLFSKYFDDPDVLGFLMTNWRRDTDGNWAWRHNWQVIERDYDHISAAPKGQPFEKPTLFVKGGNSDYITNEHKDEILRLFPQATVRIIEGAGHWLHAEKPELVARSILRFLAT
jgi:esterase